MGCWGGCWTKPKAECASRFLKGRICNISGIASGVMLKRSWNGERGVDLNKIKVCASRWSEGHISNVEGDVELLQKTLCASELSKECIFNVSGMMFRGTFREYLINVELSQNTICVLVVKKV